MKTLPNNGNSFAYYLHDQGLLYNGISCDDAYKIAVEEFGAHKFLDYDSFWEDWSETTGELGYEVAC